MGRAERATAHRERPRPTRPKGRVYAGKPRKRGWKSWFSARFTGLVRVDPPFRAGRTRLLHRDHLLAVGPDVDAGVAALVAGALEPVHRDVLGRDPARLDLGRL